MDIRKILLRSYRLKNWNYWQTEKNVDIYTNFMFFLWKTVRCVFVNRYILKILIFIISMRIKYCLLIKFQKTYYIKVRNNKYIQLSKIVPLILCRWKHALPRTNVNVKRKKEELHQKKPLDKHNFCLQFLFTLTLMSKLE